MILRLDDESNIIEVITVGGDPCSEGCLEVFDVPTDILEDIFSYKYIDGQFVRRDNVDDSLLQEARSIKIEFLNKTCHALIEGGIDVGDDHYSLTSEDQINLSKLTTQAALMPSVPIFYHADGQLCRQYTPEEMTMIAAIGVGWVTYHTTYFNYAKAYIESLTDFDDIAEFKYGMRLDQELETQLETILATTGITFDQEIDDHFDYETLKHPLSGLHESDDAVTSLFSNVGADADDVDEFRLEDIVEEVVEPVIGGDQNESNPSSDEMDVT